MYSKKGKNPIPQGTSFRLKNSVDITALKCALERDFIADVSIDVIHNEVYASVAGIEIENSRHALVEGNYVWNNTGGILVFITPGLPIKTTYDVIVRENFVMNNNHENFAEPGRERFHFKGK